MDNESVNYSIIPINTTSEFSNPLMPDDISLFTLIILGIMFFLVAVVGICGNLLVIFAVISNKMRTSMTNLLITNLAFADLIIMIFGIPEIVQFMMNRGWILENLFCKINRFILVCSLYGSVLTLMALCVER